MFEKIGKFGPFTKTPDPLAAAVRTQLARILESNVLKGSERHRDLLSYLVEETLAGRGDRLKGYAVALAVFHRDESFDPGSDPVVRLEVGRLRRALDSYYVDAGKLDPVRITIPKGANRAHFEWRADEDIGQTGEPIAKTPSVAGDDAADPYPNAAPKTGYQFFRSLHGRPVQLGALLLAAVLIFAVLSWLRVGDDARETAGAHGPAMIVLPFKMLDSSDNTRLFANSIPDDLISDLMRFPDLRLYSDLASFKQGTLADPVSLGRDLGVSYVLRGNVHSEQGKLRVNVQLVDASTGQILWNGSYDRALTPGELLALRRELSSSVATALGEPYGVVSAAAADRLVAPDAPSMASYACVLSANEYRRTFEDVLFAPALACLTNAVTKDPLYAEAWAMLGWLHLDAARQDMVPAAEKPAQIIAARDAATRALELDSANQRGLKALAAITFGQGDYKEAERLQRAAVELNPNDPETLAQLGWRLAARGDWDQGIPYLTRAISRSADPPGWYFHMIAVHDYMQGNYAAALAAAERSALVGSAIGLSLSAISKAKLGDIDGAQADLAAMAKAWPLIARDPAAAYQRFQATDQIVAALIQGLREAGWTPPAAGSR